MKVVKWLLILCVFLVTSQVKSQARLGVTIDSFPTIGVIGDTTTHAGYIFIHNYGNQIYSDSVYLGYEVDSTTHYSNSPGFGIYFSDTANIAVGDSVKKKLLIHFTPSVFRNIGTSGVVIWPIAVLGTALAPDTTSFQVVLNGAADIAKTDGEKLLVYMVASQLYIKTEGENLLKRVRIYAISGQLIEERSVYSSTIINMGNHPVGMYIAQIMFADDSQKAFKIVNLASH